MLNPKFAISLVFGGVLLFPLPIQAIAPSLSDYLWFHLPPQLTPFAPSHPRQTPTPLTNIQQEAQAITVQIWSDQFLGSGIIIAKQDGTDNYTVLTSHHLIRWVDPPYHIVTPDGVKHSAQVIAGINWGGTDLRYLSFTAPQTNYHLAKLGSSHQLTPGEAIFAAGYPLQLLPSDTENNGTILPTQTTQETPSNHQLNITSGLVYRFLDRALEEGYQLGYSNDVHKGMSGGPVLNQSGEVVAINGLHSNPIWAFDKFYEDGSPVEAQLQEIIPKYSWGIPIEKVTGDRQPM